MSRLWFLTVAFLLVSCGDNYPDAKEIPSDTWEWIGLKVDIIEYKSNRGRTILKTSTGNCYLKGHGGKSNYLSQVDCYDFGME